MPSCRPTNSVKTLKGNFYGCEVKDGNTIVLHIQGDSNCQPPTGWHKIIIPLGVGSIWASTNYPLKSLHIYIITGGSTITATDELKILGVVLDSSLTFGKHVQNTARNCNFHLRALRHIRSSLTQDIANIMASSVIASRIDYCNSLLIGISEQNLDRLE